jgi:hypothetical protein
MLCSVTNRNGAYVEHVIERSAGTCGPIADVTVTLTPEPFVAVGCVFDAPDSFSPDNCTETRALTCTAASGAGARSVVSTFIDVNRDGSIYQEMFQLTRRDPQGNATCVSAYDGTLTRKQP